MTNGHPHGIDCGLADIAARPGVAVLLGLDSADPFHKVGNAGRGKKKKSDKEEKAEWERFWLIGTLAGDLEEEEEEAGDYEEDQPERDGHGVGA